MEVNPWGPVNATLPIYRSNPNDPEGDEERIELDLTGSVEIVGDGPGRPDIGDWNFKPKVTAAGIEIKLSDAEIDDAYHALRDAL